MRPLTIRKRPHSELEVVDGGLLLLGHLHLGRLVRRGRHQMIDAANEGLMQS